MHELKEAEGFPGYYVIPAFPNYAISKEGRVVNWKSGKWLHGYKSALGYHYFHLRGHLGIERVVGRHRLLGSVFKPPKANEENLVINHLDGVKGQDTIENLEWTTQQGNIEHAGALGLSPKCKPISVRNAVSGEVKHYPSIIEYARVSGMTKDAIIHRLKFGESRLFPELRQYRYRNDNKLWFIPTVVENTKIRFGKERSVKVRYVLTGLEEEFSSLTLTAWQFGVTPAAMSQRLARTGQPVFPEYVQFKWADDISPWRDITDARLELEKTTGMRVVLVYSEIGDPTLEFASAVECAKAMNLKPTALNYRLSLRGTRIFDQCRFMYYTDCVKNSPVQ